jgi:hypothetical protein
LGREEEVEALELEEDFDAPRLEDTCDSRGHDCEEEEGHEEGKEGHDDGVGLYNEGVGVTGLLQDLHQHMI